MTRLYYPHHIAHTSLQDDNSIGWTFLRHFLPLEMATTRTFGEHLVDSRAGEMVEVNGNPFLTPTSPSPLSQDPFSPTSTEEYRADVEHLPSMDAHRAAEDAPPAYQVSSNPAPVVTFNKERGNR